VAAKVNENLSVSKRRELVFNMERCNLKMLSQALQSTAMALPHVAPLMYQQVNYN